MKKKKIAYIERNTYGWFSVTCQKVARILEGRGWKVIGFKKEDLDKLPLTKNTFVKGSIRTTRRAFDLIGVPQPKNIDIPKGLEYYARRKLWETTLGVVRRAKEKVFIKPLLNQKYFYGHIACLETNYDWDTHKECKIFDSETKDFPDSFPVLAQEVVKMDGEWRAYILKGKVKEICRYHYGDYYRGFPTIKQVQEIVNKCKEKRIAWCMDVTWTLPKGGKKKKPLLTLSESNEAFSAAYFGSNNDLITDMNLARFYEITGGK